MPYYFFENPLQQVIRCAGVRRFEPPLLISCSRAGGGPAVLSRLAPRHDVSLRRSNGKDLRGGRRRRSGRRRVHARGAKGRAPRSSPTFFVFVQGVVLINGSLRPRPDAAAARRRRRRRREPGDRRRVEEDPSGDERRRRLFDSDTRGGHRANGGSRAGGGGPSARHTVVARTTLRWGEPSRVPWGTAVHRRSTTAYGEAAGVVCRSDAADE